MIGGMQAGRIPLDTFVDLHGDRYFDQGCTGVGCQFVVHAAQLIDSEVDVDPENVWLRFATAGPNDEELEYHTHVVPAHHYMLLANV